MTQAQPPRAKTTLAQPPRAKTTLGQPPRKVARQLLSPTGARAEAEAGAGAASEAAAVGAEAARRAAGARARAVGPPPREAVERSGLPRMLTEARTRPRRGGQLRRARRG